MAKITKHTKDRMVSELLENGKFNENVEAKKRELDAAGDAVYQAIFGKYLDDMKKLPSEFFQHLNMIRLQGIPSASNPFRSLVHLSGYRPVIADFNISADFHGLSSSDEVIQKYHLAEKAYEDEVTKRKKARVEAEAMLSSVNTFKQLWKMWPESKSLLGKFEQSDKPNNALLPQNIVNNMNAAFGLPVEKEGE